MTDTQITNVELGPDAGLSTRLAVAAKSIGAIKKDSRNTQQNFDFRSIEAITGKVRSAFGDLGISIRPTYLDLISTDPIKSRGGADGYRTIVRVVYEISCDVVVGDDVRREEMDLSMLGEAVDYGDKSTSKAVQMAYKYALTELLAIGAEDPDAESPDVSHAPPVAKPLSQDELVVKLKKELADSYSVGEAKQAWSAMFTDADDVPDLTDPKTYSTIAGSLHSMISAKRDDDGEDE